MAMPDTGKMPGADGIFTRYSATQSKRDAALFRCIAVDRHLQLADRIQPLNCLEGYLGLKGRGEDPSLPSIACSPSTGGLGSPSLAVLSKLFCLRKWSENWGPLHPDLSPFTSKLPAQLHCGIAGETHRLPPKAIATFHPTLLRGHQLC